MGFIVIILIIFIVDDKIKNYMENTKEMHEKETILNGHIILERYHNKGAMLNFLEKNTKVVKYISASLLGVLSIVFMFILPKQGKKLLKLALALVIGGACSNVYDRITKGYVVDYFSFKFIKNIIFNISDICIFVGSGLLAILSFFSDNK